MSKTILITGATDGIGLEAAKLLAAKGHTLLLHGRSPEKLEAAAGAMPDGATITTHVADLSRMGDVAALAQAVTETHTKLNVLINNAGVYNTPDPITPDGLDARFAVNTIAPFLLTKQLLPLMDASGRVINVSSAAQAAVDQDALAGRSRLADGAAYAQSKLALTMWSRHLAQTLKNDGPAIIAVNPGSLLGTKMVKEAFGTAGSDIGIGADILTRAALSDEFASASGKYYDNDNGRFAPPHADALDPAKSERIVALIEEILAELT